MEAQTIGQYIRAAREAAGISREELASAVDWKGATSVSNVELGYSDVPREKLRELLVALHVPESQWADVLKLPRGTAA